MINGNEDVFERCEHDRQNPYAMISRELIGDTSISPTSRLVLIYMLSLPPGWKIYQSQLEKGVGVGEYCIRSSMRELVNGGYVDRKRERVKGVFQPYAYKIREFKKFLPNVVSQPGSPSLGNHAILNTNRVITEKDTTTRQKTPASDNTTSLKNAAAVFSSSKKSEKQRIQPSTPPAKIYPCLEGVEIPANDKIEITRRYPSEDVVKNAIEWATAPNNPPTKCLAASIKFAAKNALKREIETPTISTLDKLKKYFENGEMYNNAYCWLNDTAIAFDRGMKFEQIKLDKFFSWKKLKDMCNSFGIEVKFSCG